MPSVSPAQADCASDAVTQTRLMRRGLRAVLQQLFDRTSGALFEGGSSVGEIAHKLGLGRRRVVKGGSDRIDLPDRNTMTSTPSTPAYFGVLLERRWAEGITKVRNLFAEIRHRGYTGSFSHLARFLAPWRQAKRAFSSRVTSWRSLRPIRVRTLDPMTGQGDLAANRGGAASNPRGQMTARQVANVDALKAASAEFTAM